MKSSSPFHLTYFHLLSYISSTYIKVHPIKLFSPLLLSADARAFLGAYMKHVERLAYSVPNKLDYHPYCCCSVLSAWLTLEVPRRTHGSAWLIMAHLPRFSCPSQVSTAIALKQSIKPAESFYSEHRLYLIAKYKYLSSAPTCM